LRPAEVASLEQPFEAPALESDRLDGLVKLREQMMQALPRPQPEPPLQEVTLGSMPDAASGPSSAHAKAGDDLIGTRSVPFGQPRSYNNVSLSPNNARASVTFVDPVAGARDIWLVDTVNGSPTRFTFHAADENTAIWSPDGLRIVFNSNRGGHFDLYEKPSNLAGPEALLFADDSEKYPLSWSSDGRYVLFQSASGGEDSGVHVWVLPLFGDRKPFRLLQGAEIDGHAQFSPDGRWVAYAMASVSRTAPRNLDQSGRPEVFVSQFPGAVGQWQISIGGGTQPRWSPDGKEIYYLGVDARVMAVPVAMRRGALEAGTARPLFALFLPAQPGPASGRIGRQPLFSYDVGRDSQRFLVRTILQETAPITLVANWPALLTEPR
jgi:Tol biopolymer transport system component